MAESNAEIVRRCYAAFTAGRREEVERVMADDLVFTSPDDVGIDRATYFERCWPNSGHHRSMTVDRAVEHDDEVLVRYEIETTGGKRFRNMELLRVSDGRIHEVEVYYGATLTGADS
jgi:ketosteroid isomerase-like protein